MRVLSLATLLPLLGASTSPALPLPLHDDLHWEQLSVSVGAKTVLQPCGGKARAGRLLGVLGPSGAGKTTALGAIVDGVPAVRRKRCVGWLSPTSPRLSAGTVALLSQDDSFFGLLSVRETLELAAALQPGGPDEQQPSSAPRVDALLRSLGLWEVRDSRFDAFSRSMRTDVH